MATWSLSIGSSHESNSTGSFTIPANTGSTPQTYYVQYNDGEGGGGSTSITIPVCSETKKRNNVIATFSAIEGTGRITISLSADYAVTSTIRCSGTYSYVYNVGSGTAQTTSNWSGKIPTNEHAVEWTVTANNLKNLGTICISSPGVASDDTYDYVYSPTC